jgi:hypothetical protein
MPTGYPLVKTTIVRRTGTAPDRFPACRNGLITFIQEDILNMSTWAEVHANFQAIDGRIPPYHCYGEEENRSYLMQSILEFHVKSGHEVPATLGEDG